MRLIISLNLFLMLLITGCYGSERHKERSDGYKYAHKLNKKNPCPFLKMDPENQNATILQFLNYENEEELCCPCNPGEKLAGLCTPGNYTSTICQPCEDGTFRKEYTHGFTYCEVDQLKCGPNSIYFPSKQEPRCDCLEGYYKASDGKCTPHSECPPGEGVLTPGTRESDTKCETCPEGYQSMEYSRTEKCSPEQIVLNHPKNQHLNLENNATSDLNFQHSTEIGSTKGLVPTTDSSLTSADTPHTSIPSRKFGVNSEGFFYLGQIECSLTCVIVVIIVGSVIVIIILCIPKYRAKLFCQKSTEKVKVPSTPTQERNNNLESRSCSVVIDEEDNNEEETERHVTHEASLQSRDQEEERIQELSMPQEEAEHTTSDPLLPVSELNQHLDLGSESSDTPQNCSDCQRNRTCSSNNIPNMHSQQTPQNNPRPTCSIELRKRIRIKLSKILNWEEIQMVYRHFTKDDNPEPYLEDLEKAYMHTPVKVIKLLTKLDSMANHNFNPELLKNYLVGETIQNAADSIDEDVKEWKRYFL